MSTCVLVHCQNTCKIIYEIIFYHVEEKESKIQAIEQKLSDCQVTERQLRKVRRRRDQEVLKLHLNPLRISGLVYFYQILPSLFQEMGQNQEKILSTETRANGVEKVRYFSI